MFFDVFNGLRGVVSSPKTFESVVILYNLQVSGSWKMCMDAVDCHSYSQRVAACLFFRESATFQHRLIFILHETADIFKQRLDQFTMKPENMTLMRKIVLSVCILTAVLGSQESPRKMYIYVKCAWYPYKTHSLLVQEDETIKNVARLITEKEGVHWPFQQIRFHGTQLEFGKSLMDYRDLFMETGFPTLRDPLLVWSFDGPHRVIRIGEDEYIDHVFRYETKTVVQMKEKIRRITDNESLFQHFALFLNNKRLNEDADISGIERTDDTNRREVRGLIFDLKSIETGDWYLSKSS